MVKRSDTMTKLLVRESKHLQKREDVVYTAFQGDMVNLGFEANWRGGRTPPGVGGSW